MGKKSTCPTPGSFSAKHSHANVSSGSRMISLTVLLCGRGKLASSLCASTSVLAERRSTNDSTSQIELEQSSAQKVDWQLSTAFAARRGVNVPNVSAMELPLHEVLGRSLMPFISVTLFGPY